MCLPTLGCDLAQPGGRKGRPDLTPLADPSRGSGILPRPATPLMPAGSHLEGAPTTFRPIPFALPLQQARQVVVRRR